MQCALDCFLSKYWLNKEQNSDSRLRMCRVFFFSLFNENNDVQGHSTPSPKRNQKVTRHTHVRVLANLPLSRRSLITSSLQKLAASCRADPLSVCKRKKVSKQMQHKCGMQWIEELVRDWCVINSLNNYKTHIHSCLNIKSIFPQWIWSSISIQAPQIFQPTHLSQTILLLLFISLFNCS